MREFAVEFELKNRIPFSKYKYYHSNQIVLFVVFSNFEDFQNANFKTACCRK